MRVSIRVRPALDSESDQLSPCVFVDNEGHKIVMRDPRNPCNDEFHFEFDYAHDQCATQEQVFEKDVAPFLPTLFEGFNTTVFAYGGTGAGKV